MNNFRFFSAGATALLFNTHVGVLIYACVRRRAAFLAFFKRLQILVEGLENEVTKQRICGHDNCLLGFELNFIIPKFF